MAEAERYRVLDLWYHRRQFRDCWKDLSGQGGKRYLAMLVQPVIVLAGTANVLTNIRNRANDMSVEPVAYIKEIFSTGHDDANCAVFAEHYANEANTVGIALSADKKIVDKITKGAKMQG